MSTQLGVTSLFTVRLQGAEPRAYAALCVGGVTWWCIIMSVALTLSDSLPKP